LATRRLILTIGLLAALAVGGCSPAELARTRGGYTLAEIRPGATVDVHASPGGRRVVKLRSKTEFGTDQVFWVVERRGRWLGVTTSARGDNQLGWIAYDPLRLRIYFTRWSIRASLSARTLEVSYGGVLQHRFPVTIGRAGSSTPTGRFSVTDALAGKGVGPYYGCCVLPLSGHQPNLPPHWIGGDRIAIHGTPGAIGAAASAGCLRATNGDMVYLFSKVPIGVPVTISD
jgi:L,D-transpeptidase-like protein